MKAYISVYLRVKHNCIVVVDILIMDNETYFYKIDGFNFVTHYDDSYCLGEVQTNMKSADKLRLTCRTDNVDFVITDIEQLIRSCLKLNVIQIRVINLDNIMLEDNTVVETYHRLLACQDLFGWSESTRKS